MTAAEDRSGISEVSEFLLELDTTERRLDVLSEMSMLDPAGLERILDETEELIGRHPNQAVRLAEICAVAAQECGASQVLPRAYYVGAQANAVVGQLDTALSLIESARSEYVIVGDESNAIRTNLGLVHVLIELGRPVDALDAADEVLAAARGDGQIELGLSEQAVTRLVATALMNRGVCLEKLGRFDEALSGYQDARSTYVSLGDDLGTAKALLNQGVIYLDVGEVTEALRVFEMASAIHEKTGQTRWQSNAQINIGDAHMMLGNYALGLESFERAAALLATEGEPVSDPVLVLDTAGAYLSLNLLPEALAAYMDAEGQLKEAGMVGQRARALWGMGAALSAVSRYEEAEASLSEAADLLIQTGNEPLLAGVMLEKSALCAERGMPDEALSIAKGALDLVSDRGWPVQQTYAHLRMADLLLPDAEQVETHLAEAQARSEKIGLPLLQYRLDQRLGHLRLLQGKRDEARRLLESAIDRIERLRGSTSNEAVRVSYLRDKSAAYEDLVRLHLSAPDEQGVGRAFSVAERAKSRSLVELLSGLVEPKSSKTMDEGAELRLGKLKGDLNAVYSEWLGATGSAGRSMTPDELQSRALELEQEISLLELRANVETAASSPFQAALTPEEIVSHLEPDEVLVAYHIIEGEILAFVAHGLAFRVVRRVGNTGEVEALLQRLSAQLDRFRAGREFVDNHMAMLQKSTQRVLQMLYSEVLEDVIAAIEEVSVRSTNGDVPKLTVVPHGLLHQVPFHALHDGDAYVIDEYELSYAPSATVWALCRHPDETIGFRALAVGVPDDEIPAAEAEARSVADRLTESRLLIGPDAQCATVLAEVENRDILHFACHGLFRSDNPMFSALKLHDGWLTASDVMRTELNASLVTLSACESGRSEVIGGDEVLGLTRAFLGAGAAALVVSLWLVHDAAAVQLMDIMYDNLSKGLSRAAALRASQLELREAHPHPYYWAPYVLVGRR